MGFAKLSIDFVAKLANLERDFAKISGIAENSANRMESAFSGASSVIKSALAGIAGAFSVGALTSIVQASLDAADGLAKLSARTGETVENLSKLQYAGSLADVGTEDLEKALVRLNKVMGEAADGSKEAQEAIARFGILPTDTVGDAFSKIAERIKNTKDETLIASATNDVLGKSFATLLPLLKGGADGIKSVGDELERTGGVISTDAAQAAERFNDNMTRLNRLLKTFVDETLSPLLPVMEALSGHLVDASTESVKTANSFSILKTAFEAIAITGANVKFVFDQIGIGIAGAATQINAFSTGGISGFLRARKLVSAVLDDNRKALDDFERKIFNAGKTFSDYSNEGRGRGISGKPQEGQGILPAVPKPKAGGGSRATKAIDDGQRLVEQLRDRIRATQELTEVEKLELAIADGKYKTASAANLELARGYAETLDAIKASKVAADEEAEAQRKRLEIFAEGQRVFESVRTPMEALDAEITRLVELLDYGAISMDTFGRAASKAGEGFIKLGDKAKETSDVMDEFAKSAARNIQSAFADFLFDPFEDGMSGMLKSFGNTIKRMIAEAVSADLTKRLFGDLSKGGAGGLLEGAFSFLGGLSANANGGVYSSPSLSAFSGQVVTSPRLFAFASGAGVMGEAGPEAILPLARGSDGKLGVQGGGNTHITVNLHGLGNTADVRRAGGQVGREVLRALSGAQRFA